LWKRDGEDEKRRRGREGAKEKLRRGRGIRSMSKDEKWTGSGVDR
jgi:hypothetical protein